MVGRCSTDGFHPGTAPTKAAGIFDHLAGAREQPTAMVRPQLVECGGNREARGPTLSARTGHGPLLFQHLVNAHNGKYLRYELSLAYAFLISYTNGCLVSGASFSVVGKRLLDNPASRVFRLGCWQEQEVQGLRPSECCPV